MLGSRLHFAQPPKQRIANMTMTLCSTRTHLLVCQAAADLLCCRQHKHADSELCVPACSCLLLLLLLLLLLHLTCLSSAATLPPSAKPSKAAQLNPAADTQQQGHTHKHIRHSQIDCREALHCSEHAM
jgi:hypothetical protein